MKNNSCRTGLTAIAVISMTMMSALAADPADLKPIGAIKIQGHP